MSAKPEPREPLIESVDSINRDGPDMPQKSKYLKASKFQNFF